MGEARHDSSRWAKRLSPLLAIATAAGTLTGTVLAVTVASPAAAAITAVKGSSYGYTANVSLGGGPYERQGYGQVVCTTPPNIPEGCVDAALAPGAASPAVALPSAGGNLSQTDADGARGQYGPATIFGGIWPPTVSTGPPSGPITVASRGTTAGSGYVTSAADIVLYNPPPPNAPGGVGPPPVEADEVHTTCTATETAINASTRIVNGVLTTSTHTGDDPNTAAVEESGDPKTWEPIPANPPVNYTRTGTIDNVGDSFRVVFNEQIRNPDGSITVSAYHMYLLGPFALGDLIVGSSTCGTTPAAPPTLSISDALVVEGNAGTTTANFTITRSGNTTGSSTVSYKTTNGTATAGSDYTALPLTAVTFAAGETTKPVSVTVTGDVAGEANETFNVVLSAPTNAAVSDTTGVGTIVNDDPRTYLSISDAVVTEGNAGSATAAFTITRSGYTAGSTTVSYATADGTATVANGDYTSVALTPVTFAAGETTKPVSVSVTGDAVDEVNETFSVNLSAPGTAIIADATGTGTIVDDEGAVTAGPTTFFSVSDVNVVEGNSGATTATFTVTRSGLTTGSSSVKYATANGTAVTPSDYTAKALTLLSFAAGETTKSVAVSVIGNSITEADETFKLNLSAPVGGVISDTFGTATVLNDELTSFSVDDVTVAEGNGGTTFASFTVSRSGNTVGAASVKYSTGLATATAGTDYTAVPLTLLSFAAGETSKVVTVPIIGDAVVEPNETFLLKLSSPVGGTVADTSGTGTIFNDD